MNFMTTSTLTKAELGRVSRVRFGDLLAFNVTTDYLEANILVFARNRSHAKQVASRSEWISEGDVPWIDLRVNREPKADRHAAKYGETYISAETADEQRVLRELGWYQLESMTEECQVCHKHQWDLVPESKLEYVGGYTCAGCLKANSEVSNPGVKNQQSKK